MSAKFKQLLAAANHELIDCGNLDCIGLYFADDYQARSGSKGGNGHQFVRKFVQRLRTALPDVKVTKVEVLSQAEDVVAWQRTLNGTHEKPLQGIPASNKKVTWTEMFVSRFNGERIIEDCMVSDLAGQLMIKLRR